MIRRSHRGPCSRFVYLLWPWTLLPLLGAAPASASSLTVQSSVKMGAFAARVNISSNCGHNLHLTLSGNQSGTATNSACSTVTSTADVNGGNRTYEAGGSIRLGSGFSVASGARFTARITPTLFPDAWVQDDTPDGETIYAARFYVQANSLNPGAHEPFHFVGLDGQGDWEFRLGLKRVGSENRLYLEVKEDNGGVETTEGTNEIQLPGGTGFHWVEVGWMSSTGPSANNGEAYLCVDQPAPPTGCEPLVALDNFTGALEAVRWGAIDVPNTGGGNLGPIYLDEFESRTSLYVGPLP